MSKASEISENVFLGPTPDPTLECAFWDASSFDVLVEASDLAQVPEVRALKECAEKLRVQSQERKGPVNLEFPSSGSIMPPSWSHAEADGLLETCKWIYDLAHPQEAMRNKRRKSDDDEAIELNDMVPARKFLIHCSDGYTETSLLGLAYYMYAEGVPAHVAWIQLHREKGRNFFAYPTDVALLTQIQPRILQESPRWNKSVLDIHQPSWVTHLDGSLPSRILPYMYLGNLGHANNPEMLRELGINRILSVGESLTWPEDTVAALDWPTEHLMMVDRVQDNGVDPLWEEFDRCLKFIGKLEFSSISSDPVTEKPTEAGKLEGGATLVHCRVGVSRSATICIAEVMNSLGLSFPRA
jgi:dual specificity MAP kinase phosphatase